MLPTTDTRPAAPRHPSSTLHRVEPVYHRAVPKRDGPACTMTATLGSGPTTRARHGIGGQRPPSRLLLPKLATRALDVATPVDVIDFLAYDVTDHVVHARIEFQGDRLIDMLGSTTTVVAEDVRSRSLATSQVTRPHGSVIHLNDMAVVVATGPRGADIKRIRTIVAPVTIYAGPYVVHGFLHAPPHASPLTFSEERAWLPLTEAVLEYSFRWQAVRERHDTLLINRLHAKAVVLTDERSHEARWLAGGTPIDWPSTRDRL